MSVSNVFVGEERILCLSDTIVYRATEPVALMKGKCFVSHNDTFAFSLRGTVAFYRGVIDTFIRCPDLDTMEQQMPFFPHMLGDEPLKVSDGEITLMGWSNDHQQLRAIRFDVYPGGKPVEKAVLAPGLYLTPGIPDARLPQDADEEVMVKVALAQYKVNSRLGSKLCIGGLMHITTVTEAGARRNIVGAYPEYEEHAKRFGCPNAEEYQQFLRQHSDS